jgi:hypothetical protein
VRLPQKVLAPHSSLTQSRKRIFWSTVPFSPAWQVGTSVAWWTEGDFDFETKQTCV